MSELVLPNPQIYVPKPRLPKWARPWEHQRTLEDDIVAAISNPIDMGTTANNATSGTVVLTTTVAVPAGSKIWIEVGWFATAALTTLTGVSDGSLIWTIDIQRRNNNQTGAAIIQADAPNGLASSTAITASFSDANAADRTICGMYSTGVQIGASSAYGAIGADDNLTQSAHSGNITVSTGDILIGASHWEDGSPTTFTASGGNTKVHDFNSGSGGTSFATMYQIGTGAAIQASGTWGVISSGGSGTSTIAVAYKATSGTPFSPDRMPLGV